MSDTDKVFGVREAVRKLQRVSAAAAGVVADGEIAELLVRRVRARFAQGVSPDGKPWAGLLPSTIGRKKRKGYKYPNSPLRGSDRLYQSIKVIQGVNTGLLAGSTGLGYRIGVSDPVAAQYGRIHNYGYAGQEERRFIGLSALDVLAASNYLRRRLKSIAKA